MPSIELDHLLYAGPDLELLRNDFERRSGVVPQAGGRHAAWGTHNALVGLGAGSYLELIAPEPGSVGPWGSLFGRLAGPSLQAWCVRCGSADEVAGRLEQVEVATKRVRGERRLASGEALKWELVFPRGHTFGGALPFFIEWQGSAAHPSRTLEPRAALLGLSVQHPDVRGLARVLTAVGAVPTEVELVSGSRIALSARLSAAAAAFSLEGLLDPTAYLGEV